MSKILGQQTTGDRTEMHVAAINTALSDGSIPALTGGIEDFFGDKPDPQVISRFQAHEEKAWDDAIVAKIDPTLKKIMGTDELDAGNNADAATMAAHSTQYRAVKDAARILAMSAKSASDAAAYHRLSSTGANGENSAFDIGAFAAGNNAFDPKDYRSVVARSIAYTPAALAQGTTAELIFTTIACTPDQATYQFRVLVPTLFSSKQRNKDGTPYDMSIRRLVDATRYQSILRHDLIDIIPLYKASRAAFFADTAAITPWTTQRGDEAPFQTSALRMDTQVDLIAINSLEDNPARGNANERDMLDQGVGIKTLLVKVTNSANVSTIFMVDASQKASTGFYPVAVADSANILKNSFTETVQINSKTPTLDGNPAAVLAGVLALNPQASVSVRLSAAGEVDTETASIMLSQLGPQRLGEVYERSLTGTRRNPITDAPTLTAVSNAFTTIEIVGWVPKAKLRNTSLRDIGQLVRVQEQFKTYQIEMQSPFTAATPAGEDNNVDKAELRKMAFLAARIDNDMAAHRTFFEHIDIMRNLKGLNKDIGNHKWDRLGYPSDPYIDPQFDEIEVDLLRDTQSTSSGSKFVDITSLLSLNITDLAMTLIRESNINAALDLLGASNYKVSIVAATDPYIAAYLRTIGDARTAGVEHKVLVTSTVDELWRGKITLSLRVDLEGDASILNTGFHLAVPRYVTDLAFPRDGAVASEVTVHNRRAYIVTTPIFGVINVKNLTQAVRQSVKFKVSI